MFATICNFLYETFFHRSASKLRRSNNDLSESTPPKRVKFSENFWNSNPVRSSCQKTFPLSLSMQKENADISDDEECCIVAEMPRRKKPGNHMIAERKDAAPSKTTHRFCAWPSYYKDRIPKPNNDVEEIKPVNNPFEKSVIVRSNARNKFFNNVRSPLSCGKVAKSKMSYKCHLRRRMNFLQESYRLTEKMRYVQLLQSQALLGCFPVRSPSRSVSSRSENIPVIDLTDGEDDSTSVSESQISEDQDVQIVGEYRGVRSFQDILKLSRSNVKQVNEEIMCRISGSEPDDPSTKVLSDHTISLLDDDEDEDEEDEKSNFDSLEEKLNYVQITTHPLKEVQCQYQIDLKEHDLFELTPEQETRIKNALIPIPKQEILVKGFSLQITRQDMQTLKGLNWLNDVIIDFYMNLIVQRSELNSSLPKVYAFNTFFYPKLASCGYDSLKRWTKHVDIFSFDMILVPVHLGMHWCLAIIDFRSKSVQYYDSIGSPNDKCLELLLSYLKSESLNKKNIVFHTSNWKKQNVEDIPQQMNGSDCGVFSCIFAEYLTKNCNITFSQEDMPYFRKKMIIELLDKQLLT